MIENGIPLVRFLPSDLLPLDRINPPEDLIDFLSRILVTRYDVQILPTSDRVPVPRPSSSVSK